MSTSAIKARKPTGEVPFPLILLEGPEKAGKSLVPVVLSRSERVGMTYWFDLGEGAADEYAALPGADYVVIEHDGSYRDILEQLTAVFHEARRAALAGEPPVVAVVDSMSLAWRMLVNWTNERARRSNNGKRKLEADPDAEIDPTSNLWNDANKRHARLMDLLMTFPGIAIVTGRGKEVAVIGANGQPVEGRKTWKVEGQKDLAFDSSAWIRLTRDPRKAELIGVRSLRIQVPKGQTADVPMTQVGEWEVVDLEAFIFDVLGCNPGTRPRDLKKLHGDLLDGFAERVAAITDLNELRGLWEESTRQMKPEDWAHAKELLLARREILENPFPEADGPTLDHAKDEEPAKGEEPADEQIPGQESIPLPDEAAATPAEQEPVPEKVADPSEGEVPEPAAQSDGEPTPSDADKLAAAAAR